MKNASATYTEILDDEGTLSSFRQLGYQDPRRDLAVTIAVALLQRAGLAKRKLHNEFQPSLQMVQRSLLLQGTLVLDTQLKINTGDISIRLLLVQLYLLLGCASLAYETWQPLGIKRSIQDSLSPLLFDRISTVSPGLFLGSQPLMEPLRSYYMSVSKENAPSKVWDAFSTANYNSIVDIEAYDFALRRSCTMVMTAVEERRGTRLLGGKIEDGLKDASMLRTSRTAPEIPKSHFTNAEQEISRATLSLSMSLTMAHFRTSRVSTASRSKIWCGSAQSFRYGLPPAPRATSPCANPCNKTE